jgi:hypothetical protein
MVLWRLSYKRRKIAIFNLTNRNFQLAISKTRNTGTTEHRNTEHRNTGTASFRNTEHRNGVCCYKIIRFSDPINCHKVTSWKGQDRLLYVAKNSMFMIFLRYFRLNILFWKLREFDKNRADQEIAWIFRIPGKLGELECLVKQPPILKLKRTRI